jgi:hypothetical protein
MYLGIWRDWRYMEQWYKRSVDGHCPSECGLIEWRADGMPERFINIHFYRIRRILVYK